MDKSSLPFPQKCPAIRDAIPTTNSTTRLEKRSSVQFKHPVRDSAGRLSASRVERPQFTGGYLKRRFGHSSKKANSPFAFKGSKATVVSSLYTAATCVPVTPETIAAGKGDESPVKTGSISMKSKLLQLHERNRLIMARNQLSKSRGNHDVMLTSPLTIEVDTSDVSEKSAENQKRPSADLSTISPIYHELDPLDSYSCSGNDQHTYQSISEVREEVAKLEAQRDLSWKGTMSLNIFTDNVSSLSVQTASNQHQNVLTKAASDSDTKQNRSKSRSIFSKFWQSRRTQQTLQDETATNPLVVSPLPHSETITPSPEDTFCRQPSQWEPNLTTYQSPSSLVFCKSYISDSKNYTQSLTSSTEDDDVITEQELTCKKSPNSINNQFYLWKSNILETGIEDRMQTVFATQNSAPHLQTFAKHPTSFMPDTDKKANDYKYLSDIETNENCKLTCMSHRSKIAENEYRNNSIRDARLLAFFGHSHLNVPDNFRLDRVTPFEGQLETLSGKWPISGVCFDDSRNVYLTNVPTVSSLVIGRIAAQLRFSSPCCGVRMAEMRALWRKSESAIGSDCVAPHQQQSVNDFNWKVQREDTTQLSESNYLPSCMHVETWQNMQTILEDNEIDSNTRPLLMAQSEGLKRKEYFRSTSSRNPTPESEQNSPNESNWAIEDFKVSGVYVTPNRKCDSPAKVENCNEYDYEMKQSMKVKANESKLKLPKPVKCNTRVVQLKVTNNATINNNVATKLNLLHSGQQRKEQTLSNMGPDYTPMSLNSRQTPDVQPQRKVKRAIVRHIGTVVRDSATQLDRSFGSQLKSGSCIPRTKTKLQQTNHTQSADEKTPNANSPCENESTKNSRDQTTDLGTSETVASSEETALCKSTSDTELHDSESISSPRLLKAPSAINTISSKSKIAKSEQPNSDLCGSSDFGKIQTSTSSSLSSSLSSSQSSGSVVVDSESESLSLSSSRDLETTANENSSDSHSTSPSVDPCPNSTNENIDSSKNKRRRGKSQLIAPRTDATRCLQQLEKLRVEAKQTKHELHQKLRL